MRLRFPHFEGFRGVTQTNSPDDARKKQESFYNDQSARAFRSQLTAPLWMYSTARRKGFCQQRTAAAQAGSKRKTLVNGVLGVSVFLFLIASLGILNRELSRREHAERTAAEQKVVAVDSGQLQRRGDCGRHRGENNFAEPGRDSL